MAFQRHDHASTAGVPQPRRLVGRRSHDPAAVWAERRAPHLAFMAFQRRDQVPLLRVPQPRRLVVRRGHDPAAVRAERSAPHLAHMAFKRGDLGAARRVPQPRRAVDRRGHDRPPSGLNDALRTRLHGLREQAIRLPLASHSRAVLSEDAVTIRPPSGLNEALSTQPSWPFRAGDLGAGACVPQPRRVVVRRGHDPAAVRAERRALHPSFMASRRRDPAPIFASHSRAVLSRDAVTIRRPSGLNDALSTASFMALRAAIKLPLARVPQPRRPVAGRGHDPAAIGAERRVQHRVFMAFERRDQASARRVPQPRRLVVATRSRSGRRPG